MLAVPDPGHPEHVAPCHSCISKNETSSSGHRHSAAQVQAPSKPDLQPRPNPEHPARAFRDTPARPNCRSPRGQAIDISLPPAPHPPFLHQILVAPAPSIVSADPAGVCAGAVQCSIGQPPTSAVGVSEPLAPGNVRGRRQNAAGATQASRERQSSQERRPTECHWRNAGLTQASGL